MQQLFKYLIILTVVLSLSSCHVGRYFWWNFADINDQKKFPSRPVLKAGETFFFSEIGSENQLKFSMTAEEKQSAGTDSFEQWMTKNGTVGFLVIRNDSLLYEKYFNGFEKNTSGTSFSVSKSFTSALIGIAISEGYIKSVDQPITDYLKHFKNPGFDKITIQHVLNMETGIKFNENYFNPFAEIARYYYGRHIERYVWNLKIKQEPGKEYDYISVNTLLLSMILEEATGKKTEKYLEEKIWQKAGMEYDASWSTDKKNNGTIKSFCCINATARDFARFGRLYLNRGKHNGEQIIPEAWIDETLNVTLNPSHSTYHYQWRVLPDSAYFAMGVLGQFIYIDPSKNIIIVRLGKKIRKSAMDKTIRPFMR
jgi:CubicO group peptidase (beta-lactamase class C family)